MAYRTADQRDRWKAIAAVVLVHLILGAVILTGLNVKMGGHAVDRLRTFDIRLPDPPRLEPPPKAKAQRAPREQGAPAKRADATPVVAPKPEVPLPPIVPLTVSPVAGNGASASAGAGTAGSGTGAGGRGDGSGGGGMGSGGGNSPARLVRNLTRADYQSLTGNRVAEGSAALAIGVGITGQVDSCRVIRSSGDNFVDSGICGLVVQRLRFEPARDARGRPIPFFTNYMARWRR